MRGAPMPAEPMVLGVFADVSKAAAAVRSLRLAAYRDVRAAMPAPFPELVEALGQPNSPLGVATFIGAITGVIAGFGLCIWTSLDWPITVGGKPIVALPAYVVIGFEVSVLISALVTVTALLILTTLARRKGQLPAKEGTFTQDKIGIYVSGEPANAVRLLREGGAEEVRRVD